MSDIPVGSPPAPPGRHAAPGGWYPDPVDSTQERYWDGWQWSRNTRVRERGAPSFASSYATTSSSTEPEPYGQHSPQTYQPYQPVAAAGTQATHTADGVPLAGWWWRALACWLDSIIVSLIVLIPAFPIYQKLVAALSAYISEVMRLAQAGQTTMPTSILTDAFSTRDQYVLIGIQLCVAFAYHLLFLRWKAATPGMLISGLRVVPLDQGRFRARLDWRTVVMRVAVWLLPGANGFLLVIRLLDVLFPLWQPKRQSLHDIIAKTQVVRTR